MFRKSALAIAMLGALTTANVAALGLGEIELKSALNQPLNAEVELLSATPAEMQELRVQIASSEAFASAGIDRPLFLTKLNFNVSKNADGKPVVRISSRDVIREPFLDFLLEISWSKGRLLREYTVLVDPPVMMPASTPPVQAPALQAAPSVTRSVAARPTGRVSHTAEMPPVSVAPGEYGPTRRNDTLWGIAEKVRPDAGVSMEQTMLGLLRANPEAFIDNNINNLKAGYILRVPSRDNMTSVGKTEALRETRAQYAAWREARGLTAPAQPAAVAESAAPQAADTVAAEPRLELVAPELSDSGSTAAGEVGAELEAMRRDLMMTNEALEAERRQGEEMSGRLAMLEEQIVNMQRLIQLKDNELARLQAQAGGEVMEAPVEQAEETVVAEADVAGEDAVATEVAGEALPESDIVAGEEMLAEGEATVTAEPAEGQPIEAAGVESPADETPVEEAVQQPVEEAAAAPEADVFAEPAVPETVTTPGFIDRLLQNPLWLGAGAAVLALLAFVGLRRKRSTETGFEESILQASQSKASSAADSEIVAAEPESTESRATESSLLSEFAVSDMGSMRSDGEADPLAEADVYLAYGRFQQAEDLIKDALQGNPEHEDLNLKLCEVYLAAKNAPAFDEHAQGILARLENSEDPLWKKVAEMGRELSPASPMYQEGAAAPASGKTDELESFGEEAASFDMGDTDFGTAAEDLSEASAAEDQGLDFSMDFSLDAEESKAKAQPDSVEFTPPEEIAGESVAPELNMDMDSIEPEAVATDNSLDFDIEGLDLGLDTEEDIDAETGDGQLTDLDEVSTKLDLARAYIDMGDPDGAKSILDEVMEEGSDDQKSEAQGILEQIS